MRSRIGRPSPALIIAVIALFIALGGTGYAAATGSIDSREIKNSSIQGKDVKNNSLTGSDVSESKLGKIPSATKADSASTAATATGIADNTVSTTKVADGSLNDEDIGDIAATDVTVPIGNVAAQDCNNNPVNVGGGDLSDAHVIVTPQFSTSATNINYTAENKVVAGQINIKTCNGTAAAVNDGNTTFSILIIR